MEARSLCLDDDKTILQFLFRAGTALKRSTWKDGPLGILDWHRAGASNPEHRERNPELGALADEFYGPFRSVGQPIASRFTSLADAYNVMLEANEKGEVEFHYRTVAHEETSYFHLDDTPFAKLGTFPIFGLYFVREDDPYRYGEFLQNVLCYEDSIPEDAPVNEYAQNEFEAYLDTVDGSELERSGDGIERLDLPEPEAMDSDPHFSDRITFEVPSGDLTFTDELLEALADDDGCDYEDKAKEAIRERLAEQAREDAREYFSGNLILPEAALVGAHPA